MIPWDRGNVEEYVHVLVSESSDDVVVVETSLGGIRGRVVSAPQGDLTGVTVDEYLGIPFAVPPVGQLRFADPVPLDRLPSGTLTPHLSLLSPLCLYHHQILYSSCNRSNCQGSIVPATKGVK